eukprot:Nk52_evm6s16 gene=Nk52_evmTU6s16
MADMKQSGEDEEDGNLQEPPVRTKKGRSGRRAVKEKRREQKLMHEVERFIASTQMGAETGDSLCSFDRCSSEEETLYIVPKKGDVAIGACKGKGTTTSNERRAADSDKKKHRGRSRKNKLNNEDPSSPVNRDGILHIKNTPSKKDGPNKKSDANRRDMLNRKDTPDKQSTPGGRNKSSKSDRKESQYARSKLFYDSHRNTAAIQKGLKDGSLKEGVIRLSNKSFNSAFVPIADLKRDVFINGMKDRNRALHGDTVIVEVFPRKEWRVLKQDMDREIDVMEALEKGMFELTVEQKKRFGDTNELDVPSGAQTPIDVLKSVSQSLENGNESPSVCPTELPDRFVQPTGKVVAIVKRHSLQNVIVKIQPLQQEVERKVNESVLDSFAGEKVVYCFPVDVKFPRCKLNYSQMPKDFLDKYESVYKGKLFSVSLKSWPESQKYPFMKLSECIGDRGCLVAETKALLSANNIEDVPFAESVLKCLPGKDWKIPEEEIAKRLDLRKSRIFTIDPPTAKDLDDALSCTKCADGTYEVGVHIADVTYFVDAHSELDRVARSKATTVYLVQYAIPMLPAKLSEDLCSLNPGTDRLAFSVIWKLDCNGNIKSTWFGRTIINCCARLSYHHAQILIDHSVSGKPFSVLGESPIVDDYGLVLCAEAPELHPLESIYKDTIALHSIAKTMRKRRFDGGALRINKSKLSFRRNQETGLPESVGIYEMRESNFLVEEFMLLANMSVAKKIYSAFPEQALLRRHPPPVDNKLQEAADTMKLAGISIDVTCSKSIQRSLEALESEKLGDAVLEVVSNYLAKPMNLALYFCTGDLEEEKFRHFALNVPFYTHFTSPIRRYADVIVHRLLHSALSKDPFLFETEDVTKIAQNCNDRKMASKLAQEQSDLIFLAAYLSEHPVETTAIVSTIMDRSFQLLVPNYGVEQRVYAEDIDGVEDFSFDKEEKCLLLKIKKSCLGKPTVSLKLFAEVTVKLSANIKKDTTITLTVVRFH